MTTQKTHAGPTRAVRGLIWPIVFTAISVSLFISLGVWQLHRLDWKLDLIKRIETRSRAAPMSLDSALDAAAGTEPRELEFQRVSVRGRFNHAHERHLFALLDGAPGWRVITPLETAQDGAQGSSQSRVVLVDRGFVPTALKEPQSRPRGQIEGEVELTGAIRAPGHKDWLGPDNDPARNQWHWLDLAGMSAWRGASGGAAPFLIEAEAAAVPGGWPKSGAATAQVPNRHLEYALTWFGLAATFVLMFGVFAWGRLRGR